MKIKDHPSEETFRRIINYASIVLKYDRDAIKYLFSEDTFCSINYNQVDNISDLFIEIRLEGATIICAFDNETKLCNVSFVFFDDNKALNHFIRICNLLYSYDFMNGYWYSSFCTICLQIDKKHKDIIIVFKPKEK